MFKINILVLHYELHCYERKNVPFIDCYVKLLGAAIAFYVLMCRQYELYKREEAIHRSVHWQMMLMFVGSLFFLQVWGMGHL